MKLNELINKKSSNSLSELNKNYISSNNKMINQKADLAIKNNKKIQIYKNFYLIKFLSKIICLIFFFQIYISISKKKTNKKRVGVINLFHMQNIGNILVKFALFKKLKEFGLNPVIICPNKYEEVNISFINRTTVLKHIGDFSELNKSDYDYLF